jgi:hypothetical protein
VLLPIRAVYNLSGSVYLFHCNTIYKADVLAHSQKKLSVLPCTGDVTRKPHHLHISVTAHDLSEIRNPVPYRFFNFPCSSSFTFAKPGLAQGLPIEIDLRQEGH